MYTLYCLVFKAHFRVRVLKMVIWGYSSVGRAPALQAGGQEFESLYLHHEIFIKESGIS